MRPTRISVVIPAFDDELTVAAAVCSVLDQQLRTTDEVEIVVVDDGSRDRTSDAAASTGDDAVQVVRQENAGPGAARNRGVAETTGDLLVFLDADDQLLPGALESFATARDRPGGQPAPLVRSGATVRQPDGTQQTLLSWPDPHPYARGVHFTGSFAIDRSLFDVIGGYDPTFEFGENSELLLRAQREVFRRGDEVAFVDAPTILYFKHPSGRNADRDRIISSGHRLVAVHADTLRDDPEMLSNTLAVTSRHLRSAGRRREAARDAARALRLRPREWRFWARLVLCAVPNVDGGRARRLSRPGDRPRRRGSAER